MNHLDILRAELEKLHRQAEPPPPAKRFTLSDEQIDSFFETVALPAFRRIADELKSFPLRVYIYKHSVVARIVIKDEATSFNFGVAVYNSADALQIYFNYSRKFAAPLVRVRSSFDGPIGFPCETICLNEYEKVTGERLIEQFTRFYLDRDKIAARINEERNIARERMNTEIEKQRRINVMNGEAFLNEDYIE